MLCEIAAYYKKQGMTLWDAILKTSRCDEDPIKAWELHNADLKKRTQYLNSLHLDHLHYESSNGTNFKVWLIEDADFLAGGERTLGKNIFFNPNIPSEQVFTTPLTGKAEGTLVASKPLSYNGEVIEDFSISFKDGKVCGVKAKKNQALLEKMVKMDDV